MHGDAHRVDMRRYFPSRSPLPITVPSFWFTSQTA
jgi:hypothetical protein